MTEKAAARAAEGAERKARRASEAGTFLGMLGGLGSLGMGAASLPGFGGAAGAAGAAAAGGAAAATPIGAILGPIGLGLGAFGTIGSAIAQNEGQRARDKASDIRKEATEFAAEKLPQTTKGLEKITSMTPTYSGFESSFLGGQGMSRPRRTAQQASPFADALADISFIE
tara:strand:- start:303 stop:812 length:510 start_codon:yes stop_codon:yes gene_type:complete